jgi:lipopolysaccharide transport system ATP-binding protein
MLSVIKVESLSKKYLISHQARGSYVALRDVIASGAKNIGSRLLHPFAERSSTGTKEEFWALRDIGFEIKQGDRLGIIGKNGAGKSTLLKVLSRITEPTSGRVSIKGRVASLLEVGTGFHPELTGRENIYLNGAILGMTKSEIKRKFDEIVAFAEVDRFLDTPVKRYSSGMYVRLAFAIAAHLEPEILVIDEVLAVGDVQFQKKCLGKMEDVSAKEGRTVLFVSHDMSAVKALCNQVILLANGQIVSKGEVEQQIANYLDLHFRNKSSSKVEKYPLSADLLLNLFEVSPGSVVSGGPLNFCLEFKAAQQLSIQAVTIIFYSSLGTRVAVIDLRKPDGPYVLTSSSSQMFKGVIQSVPFVEGDYSVSLHVIYGEVRKEFKDMLTLNIQSKPFLKGFAPYSPSVCGVVELESTFDYSSCQYDR